jgi:hypothetical protein
MLIFGIAILLLVGMVGPAFAGPLGQAIKGDIHSFTAIGATNPGDPINISSLVHAHQKIQNSNLYYEVYSPSMTLVDTREIDPGNMAIDDTFSDSWSTYNTPEIGNYTITLCWSTGGSHNCDIDYAEIIIFSVPTIGFGLTIVALGLLGLFLWQNRRQFSEVRI